MLGLTSTGLLRVLSELNERGKTHEQLIDTLNATRSIIIAHTSQQNYDDLVEQCNNDYTKECHDLMHVILPGVDCEDILVVEDDADPGSHALEESVAPKICDRYLGVEIRDFSGQEPISWEKNQFADAINNSVATPQKISSVFNIPTQRLNKYARHVKNQCRYDEVAIQTKGKIASIKTI